MLSLSIAAAVTHLSRLLVAMLIIRQKTSAESVHPKL